MLKEGIKDPGNWGSFKWTSLPASPSFVNKPREIRPNFHITVEFFQLVQGAQALDMDPKALK